MLVQLVLMEMIIDSSLAIGGKAIIIKKGKKKYYLGLIKK